MPIYIDIEHVYISALTSALFERSISMKRDPQKRPIYIRETQKKGPNIYIYIHRIYRYRENRASGNASRLFRSRDLYQ